MSVTLIEFSKGNSRSPTTRQSYTNLIKSLIVNLLKTVKKEGTIELTYYETKSRLICFLKYKFENLN